MYDYEDPEEDAIAECTWSGTPGEFCELIGSEDCDWDCPDTDDMWAGLRGETIEEVT